MKCMFLEYPANHLIFLNSGKLLNRIYHPLFGGIPFKAPIADPKVLALNERN